MASHSMDDSKTDKPKISYNAESQKQIPSKVPSPFEILKKYRSQQKRFRTEESIVPSTTDQVSSATSIMKMASRMKQIDSNYDMSNFQPHLSLENTKNLKLAMRLLDATECFSGHQYDEAKHWLVEILLASSNSNHAIERIITCFAQDLIERIDEARGHIDLEREVVDVDVDEALTELNSIIHESERKLPFSQITHFTAIQTILDSVGSARRIHFIDIGKKLASHWILMIHALADRENVPLEQLKITAVCTPKDNIEETGKILSSFAQSMNLPFVFKTLNAEMEQVKKDLLELETDEIVAVYMELCLVALSNCPEKTETLIETIKALDPYVIVVNDIEADARASSFISRFYEAVIICSAQFDCLEVCLGRNDQCRNIIEKLYFQEIIKNGVMAEDDGTSFRRCLKIDFWREYFAKFGIVETELSLQSMYQAALLLKEYDCWRCCTLSLNGKSMLVGWDGIPLRSVSAWKIKGI